MAELKRKSDEEAAAEANARRRRAELEREQVRAQEAYKMAKMVQDNAKRQSDELRAQVEEDRSEAVRTAWQEQLRAAIDEDMEAKRELEARRKQAVQKAVESERLYLEQERARAMVEQQALQEKQKAEKIAREKGGEGSTLMFVDGWMDGWMGKGSRGCRLLLLLNPTPCSCLLCSFVVVDR